MLENYEIKALEWQVVDYNAWADHAVNSGCFSDTETALHYKAGKCAGRMIKSHEGKYGIIEAKTLEEKVNICYNHAEYKDRVARDAEEIPQD